MDQSEWITSPTTKGANLLDQLISFDDLIYKDTQKTQKPTYGQVFVDQLNLASPLGPTYTLALLVNSTSYTAPAAWGAVGHEAILRQYLIDKNLMQPGDDFTFKVVDAPFPLTQLFAAIMKS